MTKEEQVIEVLEKIRPYIQRDGGDIEFDSLVDGVVTVKLTGACVGCMAIDVTLKEGVEVLLMDEIPGITEVRLAADI